jgi:hypothetical protein
MKPTQHIKFYNFIPEVIVDINKVDTLPTDWVRYLRYHGYWRLPTTRIQEYKDRCDRVLAERMLYE